MANIQTKGLTTGKRLRMCSDAARLHWPYLFAAANGLARLEYDYDKIIEAGYVEFDNPPTEKEIQGFLKEYRDAHLVFLYTCEEKVWAQFEAKKDSLPRWKTKSDKESPAPPEPQYSEWVSSYKDTGRIAAEVFGELPKTSVNLPKHSGSFGKLRETSVRIPVTSPDSTLPEVLQEGEGVVEVEEEGVNLKSITRPPVKISPITPDRSRLYGKFAEFIKPYPNQTRLESGTQAWIALVDREEITDETFPEVIAGRDRWIDSREWAEEDGKYVPQSKVFLIGNEKHHGRLWKDRPQPSAESKANRRMKQSGDGTDAYALFVPSRGGPA